jgi:hypothetical protein
VGIHGIHRGRVWDAVATVAAELSGDALVAVVLEGRTEVEIGRSETDIAVLTSAVGLAPPFRLEAVRRDGGLWAVGANRIEVIELTDDPGGSEIELAFDGRERTVVVDGSPTLAGVPELERLGRRAGSSYVVLARRIAGRTWEVEVSAL